jgi:acyl-CoA thioesterase-1
MKRVILPGTCILLVLTLVCACSPGPDPIEGPGEAQDSPLGAGVRPGTEEWPVILAFGDSLTAGHMVDREMSYPSQLEARLSLEGYRYRVVNDGESGLTTGGALARLDRAVALEPEVVVVALGGNDGLYGTPIGTAKENLHTIVTAFLESGADVVLAGITLPRNYGPDYIRAFEDMYVELASEFDVAFVPFLLAGVVDLENPTATIGVLMQGDGTHPTGAGYTIVADTVFKAIEPYLER